jgi:hypothetical protein
MWSRPPMKWNLLGQRGFRESDLPEGSWDITVRLLAAHNERVRLTVV